MAEIYGSRQLSSLPEMRDESKREYLLQVHRLHRDIHALDHVAHALRNLPHRDRGLHPARHRIYPRGQFEEVELFVLFPDGVLSVDLRDVAVALLYRLLLVS